MAAAQGAGESVGAMIEQKLGKAGVKLVEACNLIALDLPGLQPGDISLDVTTQSRIFRSQRGGYNQWLSVPYAIGPTAGSEGWTFGNSEEALAKVKEAVKSEEIRVGTVCLLPFEVDLKVATLRMGALVPDRQATYKCLRCGATKQASERKVQQARWSFYCQACYDKSKGDSKLGSRKDVELCQKFRMDRPRNLEAYHSGSLRDALAKEVAMAALTPADGGGKLHLPRAFVMFQPGQSRVDWEPADEDYAGKMLLQRCALAGQYPVPMRLAIDAYAPNRGWEVRPQARRFAPLKVPGIMGVQLLVDGRAAGWITRSELNLRYQSIGWLRQVPLWIEPQEQWAKEV